MQLGDPKRIIFVNGRYLFDEAQGLTGGFVRAEPAAVKRLHQLFAFFRFLHEDILVGIEAALLH